VGSGEGSEDKERPVGTAATAWESKGLRTNGAGMPCVNAGIMQLRQAVKEVRAAVLRGSLHEALVANGTNQFFLEDGSEEGWSLVTVGPGGSVPSAVAATKSWL
jgi:hypothetical protein